MAQIATKAILGEKLKDLGYEDGFVPWETANVHAQSASFLIPQSCIKWTPI